MPQTVHLMVAKSPHDAIEATEKLGWIRIAATRFVTPSPQKWDIWLYCNPSEVPRLPPATIMYVAPGTKNSPMWEQFEKVATDLNYVLTDMPEPTVPEVMAGEEPVEDANETA